MIENYLKFIGVPESTITKLTSGEDGIDVEALANEDRELIGKVYAKQNPVKDESLIVELKNTKREVAKLLRDSGISLGDLSVSKFEVMSSKEIAEALKPLVSGHLTAIKSQTDESIKAELKRVTELANQLQDDLEAEKNKHKEEVLNIKNEVTKQIQNTKLVESINKLHSAASWGIDGKILDAVKDAGLSKIKSYGVVVDDNGNIQTATGGPVTLEDGKTVIKTIGEMHKQIFGDAFKASNGTPAQPKTQTQQQSGAQVDNTSALEAEARAAGAL